MITENASLEKINTFGLKVFAKLYSKFRNVNELNQLMSEHQSLKKLVIGGGSNILFTQDFDGIVLKNEILGIEVLSETENHVLVKVGAGENWHEFVLYCVDQNWGGIENLSLIPGSVGASPMQNIGAYGVEIKDVFEELEAYEISSGTVKIFNTGDCEFGYRESVFKRALKDKYVITSVTYKLDKQHKLNSSYGAIETELTAHGIEEPTIRDISNAVIRIRESKLPNPKEIGNAGSFFKNPVVDNKVLERVKSEFDQVPNYPAAGGKVKLAAGWLIERAGWKGKTFDTFGVHKNQALVLVNYGNSKGEDILKLSEEIIEDVQLKFNVTLEREVNII